MWAQCPHRWKTAYIDGHREFTESIHTLFGTSMHEVIQTFLHVMYTETAKKAEAYRKKYNEEVTHITDMSDDSVISEFTAAFE